VVEVCEESKPRGSNSSCDKSTLAREHRVLMVFALAVVALAAKLVLEPAAFRILFFPED